jgi:uncharacterized protein (DUF1800 family)
MAKPTSEPALPSKRQTIGRGTAAAHGSVMNTTLRALNGFGLGARIGEPSRVRDARGWLVAQLDGGPPLVGAPEVAARTSVAEALRAFRTAQSGGALRQQERRQARRRLMQIAAAEGDAALTERVVSERPFVERLVAFWSNHLCVSAGAKVLVAPLAGSYEREAIRPHVLGRFEDLVLASAKHPAMLVYLDNFQSIGPTSRVRPGDTAHDSGAGSTRTTRASCWSCTRSVWMAVTRNKTCRSLRRSSRGGR